MLGLNDKNLDFSKYVEGTPKKYLLIFRYFFLNACISLYKSS